jgi:hypothetical protein
VSSRHKWLLGENPASFIVCLPVNPAQPRIPCPMELNPSIICYRSVLCVVALAQPWGRWSGTLQSGI